MANDISLTVRLPHVLNVQLQEVSKEMGITKSNLLRSAIHDFVSNKYISLNFSEDSCKRDRLVLNINQITYGILKKLCDEHSLSVNSVVTVAAISALERSTKWLQSVKK